MVKSLVIAENFVFQLKDEASNIDKIFQRILNYHFLHFPNSLIWFYFFKAQKCRRTLLWELDRQVVVRKGSSVCHRFVLLIIMYTWFFYIISLKNLSVIAQATQSFRISFLVCMLTFGNGVNSGLGMIAVVAHTFGIMQGLGMRAVYYIFLVCVTIYRSNAFGD